jgi:cation transport ATPase
MRRNSIQLSRRHEWLVYGIVGSLFLSGAAWAWLHYLARSPSEFGGGNPAETWMLKLHGAAAMAVLVMIGSLLPIHVRFAWRARRNLRTGLSVLALLGFLILTGYSLYYAGGERLRWWMSVSHLWIGLAIGPILILHVWRGKSGRPHRPGRKIKLRAAPAAGPAQQTGAGPFHHRESA